MKIYNTMSGRKEEFVPLEEGKVKMYACGITVSGEAHIGHGYQALIYDIMRSYLEKKGYQVTYARNYTDVDDKIILKAHEAGVPADEYAKEMIKKIDATMSAFNVGEPTIWLKATENMGNIISFVQSLIEKGHAYPTKKGDVYFDVTSFREYGKLSHRSFEDALDGVRVENDEEKRNPHDFALWKSAKPGEISWDSPWGKGRPGWHIECSAMNRAAFGDQIDIHGGGRDLIFPHHENEIAQTEALTGKPFVKYWTHNGLIKVNGQKMSKSLGNSLLLDDLMKQYTDEAVKFGLLQTNYRADINITDDLFPAAEKHLHEFYTVFGRVEAAFPGMGGTNEAIDKRFDECMDDDFNFALAISDLYGYFKEINKKLAAGDKSAAADCAQLRKTYSLLGFFRKSTADYMAAYAARNSEDVPGEVQATAEERFAARKARDWAKSDELREKLRLAGYAVKDAKDGYELTRIK